MTTEQISCGRSDGNGEIKYAQNSPALLLRKQVGNKRRRDCDKGRLANANQRMANQQFGVGVGNRGKQREAAPEDRAADDDPLTRIAVGERSNKRRRHHVEEQECAGEVTNLRVAQVKFALHQRLHGEQHRAVYIVQQIQRGEQDQRGARVKFRGVHEIERI